MAGSADNPSDPDTQIEKELFQSGDTSLCQATNAASVSHPDPVTVFEILKRDFHSFREQATKDKAEAKVYWVRIAELEKEQFSLFFLPCLYKLKYCTFKLFNKRGKIPFSWECYFMSFRDMFLLRIIFWVGENRFSNPRAI